MMKIKLIAGHFFVVSMLGVMLNPAFAQTDMERRVIEMERQLNELKAVIRQQQEKTNEVSSKVEQVVQSKAADPAQSNVKLSPNTTLTYGGFIKVDAMYSDYQDGPRPGNIGDEILVPSTIPIGGESEGAKFDAHVKTSRLNFKTVTETDVGNVTAFVELDFLSGGGDERISNSTNPRIRHAFLSWDRSEKSNLLIGQTWSTFFNVGALPEAVDFIGPTSGTVFNRQQQIRWTQKNAGGSFMFALENPSTSLAEAGAGIAASNFDDNSIPDIVARWNSKNWTLAVVGREISVDDSASGGFDESKFGAAINFSGKVVFANGNDLKYSIATGNLGRYIALNAFRDGGVDAGGNLDLTTVTGGYVAYRHFWTKKLRSTFMYALSQASLADGLADTNTERVSNFNVNLMYSPTPKLTFGGAIIAADRELENGASGDLTRIQATAKFAF